uniref:FP protein C-terminal domain-containing protein n=1 Tax=Heliothis virescens TaxID=7102 RepID=A0A2A4JBL7_HELVI
MKYHQTCLSTKYPLLSLNTDNLPQKWTCYQCSEDTSKSDSGNAQSPTPKRFNPNVTVRGSKRQALQSPPQILTSNDSVDNIRTIIEELIDIKFDNLLEKLNASLSDTICQQLRSVQTEIKNVREEVLQVKKSVDFVTSQYDDFIKEHNEAKVTMKLMQKQNEEMANSMSDMLARINQLEQNARSNNVEIQCVPEKKDENLIDIVTSLGNTTGAKLKTEHIINCTRIAKINKESNRPRSIVVQFSSVKIRDEFLAANINFNKAHPENKLNSSHLGIPGGKTPIFIVEHLSPYNKSLHAAARRVAKEKGYKHLWVRNGRIYMRKVDDSEYILIRNIKTLEKL